MNISHEQNNDQESGSLADDRANSGLEKDLPFSPITGCTLAILLAVIGGLFVFQIGRLIYFGEIRFGGPDLNPNRIWLVREPENAGLSVSTTSVVSGSLDSDEVCLQTQIWSLFWRRDDSRQISSYCLCYQRDDGAWRQTGECPVGNLP